MATVSARSAANLGTVKEELGTVVRKALEAAPPWLDFAVISGLRTTEQQQELFRKGRDEDGNIVDRDAVVTFKDGIHQKSRHQFGSAVDIVAYVDGHISWEKEHNLRAASYVAGFAAAHGVRLTGGIKWGWDHGHLELETS